MPWSGAGQLLELGERLSIKQRSARRFTGATRLGADRAVTVMLGVPGAFLGAQRAIAHTALEQAMNDKVIGLGGPGEDPRDEVAHIGAGEAESDAFAHLGDVGFDEIRVRARRACLETVQASIDRCGDLVDSERDAGRRGVQHVPRVSHAPSPCGRSTTPLRITLTTV